MESIEKVNEYLLSTVAKIKSLPKDSFALDSHLIYDLYFDSVDIIDLLTEIEEELNVFIDEDKLEKLTTLQSVARAIMQCRPQS